MQIFSEDTQSHFNPIFHLTAAQEWSCIAWKMYALIRESEGRVEPIIIVWYKRRLEKRQIAERQNKKLHHHSLTDNMTAEYALHVSHPAEHSPQEYTCAEMAEPLWHDERRGGRKRWNINHRRGLYSSCHDNSAGWKSLTFPSPETHWHSVPLYLRLKQERAPPWL